MSSHHGCNDLVISCIDYRFRDSVAAWIKENLGNQSDLVAVAGTSKAIIDETSRDYVLGLIKIGVDLHGVCRVHLLDHMDCGAYGGSSQHTGDEAEVAFHASKLDEAEQIIRQHFPQLEIVKYVMTTSGIEQLAAEAAPA